MDRADQDRARPTERALAAWSALAPTLQAGSWRRAARMADGPWSGAEPASVWALSQPLAAAVALVRIGALPPAALAPLLDALERYRVGDGYGPFPGSRDRFYDDNAWVGLDLVGIHLATGEAVALAAARRVLGFVREGEHPDGGVVWEEKRGSPRNTCSTAPAAQLALWIHVLAGDPDALAFAQRCRAFLESSLRHDDRLYADHLDPDGHVDHSLFSYNQGTPVGVDVLLHRITGDDSFLDSASVTAVASIAHFTAGDQGDQVWFHQPCFNAIWLRNLVTLDAVRPVPGLWDLVDAYTERLWSAGRNPATGWFTESNIGRYERGGVLDQGGIVQLLALRAWPPDLIADLV